MKPIRIVGDPENIFGGSSFPEMEVRATVALDGGTRRCCNNENCLNDYPCAEHPDGQS